MVSKVVKTRRALRVVVAAGSPNVGYHLDHLVQVPWHPMYELEDVGLLGKSIYISYIQSSCFGWRLSIANPDSGTMTTQIVRRRRRRQSTPYTSLRTTQSALAIAASKSISISSSSAMIAHWLLVDDVDTSITTTSRMACIEIGARGR